MPQRNTIIWDWNGTLLDDVEICLASINSMLRVRSLPELSTDKYRTVFTFPVIEYYKEIGFDFTTEKWEPVAMEFISQYMSMLPECKLTPFAVKALDFFRKQGYRQAIISAMQHDALVKSVSDLGIHSYFEYIGGISDHYAVSKVDNARDYFSRASLNPEQATLIGDTIHDSEVAAELQCRCILVSTGHQSTSRLGITGLPVINDLSEIYKVI